MWISAWTSLVRLDFMQVQIIKIELITVEKKALQRIAKAAAEGLCVACLKPLDETRTVRHCHERCYRATLRAIKAGKTTEEERLREGKLLECDEVGRKASNPVTCELEKR
jgi:hypothetical protein